MKGAEKIKQVFERNAKALSLRPSIGQGTAISKVRLKEGFFCEVEDGKWKLTVDMSEKSGGNDSAPNPGVLGRAALGSCLAIGYASFAAKMEIPVDAIEVEVQADYDSRAMYGVDNATPGYKQIRYIVTVESEAAESDILRMLDEADAHSDFLYVFSKPQDVRREVRVVAKQK